MVRRPGGRFVSVLVAVDTPPPSQRPLTVVGAVAVWFFFIFYTHSLVPTAEGEYKVGGAGTACACTVRVHSHGRRCAHMRTHACWAQLLGRLGLVVRAWCVVLPFPRLLRVRGLKTW